MKLTANVDGSSMGNPGEAGCGVIIRDESGKVLRSFGRYIGKATNNVAEYQALISCLELAAGLEARSLEVLSDSELLVRQMNGLYRVKQDHLRALHGRALELIRNSAMVISIRHIGREKNSEADSLARKAVIIRGEVTGSSEANGV